MGSLKVVSLERIQRCVRSWNANHLSGMRQFGVRQKALGASMKQAMNGCRVSSFCRTSVGLLAEVISEYTVCLHEDLYLHFSIRLLVNLLHIEATSNDTNIYIDITTDNGRLQPHHYYVI